MQNTAKFAVDKIVMLQELSDSQLAIGEVWICCEGENLHNLPITEDALNSAIPTLYNKFLVAGFDGNDFKSHEGKKQLILGFFPKENEAVIKINEENNKKYIVANVIISKVYAEWAYEIFNDDNYREVSMEIIVTDEEEIDGVTYITEFCFLGVTVLGLKYTAACPGSNIQITKFSTDKMIEVGEDAYKKYIVFGKTLKWQIPSKVKKNIKEGFKLRKEYGYGGNSVSLATAKYLSTNVEINEEKGRHYKKYAPKLQNEIDFSEPPTKEYINYMLWGGKEGFEWLKTIWEDIEYNDNLIEKYFVSKDKIASKPPLTVDKSAESMSETAWGSVDKATLKKSVIMASNFKSIAKSVFMKLEDGWEDGIEGALKYPVMQKKGKKLVYNRYGLSTALAFAKKMNDNDVVNKVEKIMNKLNIDNGKEENMSVKKDFAELTYANIMTILTKSLRDNNNGDLYISDITDEYAIIYDYEECFYYKVPYSIIDGIGSLDFENKIAVVANWKEDFSLDENADIGAIQQMLNDETIKNQGLANQVTLSDDIEIDETTKFSEDEKTEEMGCKENMSEEEMGCKETMSEEEGEGEEESPESEEEQEEEENQENMAVEEDETKKDESEEETEKDDQSGKATMSYEELFSKCETLEETIKELQEFKQSVELEKKNAIVFSTLAEVQSRCLDIPQVEIENWKSDSDNFSFEHIEDWKNKVFSQAFMFSKENNKDIKGNVMKMGMPFANNKIEKKSLWGK